MKLLAGTHYDPATAGTASTASLLAMTALDTSNLRLTFTAPSNGSVLVRMRGCIGNGATTSATILLGVLDGATVKGRQAPLVGSHNGAATAQMNGAASFIVSGLTAGQSYTWDAAYGVEFAVASTQIKYGGPNNTTLNDAYGGFSYEIWDTPGLLASTLYDPGTAVSKSIASLLAMTALDTTNLRLSFVCPSRGVVLVRMRGVISDTSVVNTNTIYGVLDGATVRGRSHGIGHIGFVGQTGVTTSNAIQEATFLVSGLTAGTTYNWDAAYGVETVAASGNVKYGGPDNNSQQDAWGGFSYDIWNVDDLPRAIGAMA
jgi:hypothetical protein